MIYLETLGRGLLGMAVLIGICFLLCRKKKAINWRTIFMALGMQILFAILVLWVPFINSAFDWLATMFVKVLQFARYGSEFLFGSLVTDTDSFGFIFAFQVLPTIIFFSALSSVLYYAGILQLVVKGMAWLMTKTLKISGPESLSTAGNIFLGQTEAPLLIKPYIEKMTRSEILCIMTGGMATIAGGVFAAYIGFLGGEDIEARIYFAKHLLTASIISAPAAIMASKLLLPETEKVHNPNTLDLIASESNNVLDAISQGTTDGVKLAVNVGVMLLVFTALIFLANGILLKIGEISGLNSWVVNLTDGKYEGFSFTFLLGLLFSPVAWLLGTPGQDIMAIGQLLGQKTMINEFVAYADLNTLRNTTGLDPKSILIATYALCGFSNFASIGIQIGGISTMAPNQRKTLTELGLYSLIAGTVACFFTAIIAGVMYSF